jgi:hypothetical protein
MRLEKEKGLQHIQTSFKGGNFGLTRKGPRTLLRTKMPNGTHTERLNTNTLSSRRREGFRGPPFARKGTCCHFEGGISILIRHKRL